MITATSRYASWAVDVVTDSRGNTHQSLEQPAPQQTSFNFTYYQIQQGDTPDWLAYRFLNDGRLWWVIANANPEIIDWTSLTFGTIIRIPSV